MEVTASVTSHLELQEKEVQMIKEKYASQCKVITDVGDFKHIVIIKPEDTDISIKFQLVAGYPNELPCVITRSETIALEGVPEVKSIIDTTVKNNTGLPVIDKITRKLVSFFKEKGMPCQFDQVLSPYKKHKERPRRSKLQIPNSEATSEKKLSMKTAEDVIRRIQWDKSLHADCFIIGYLDRFTGIVEKPFSLFSWEDIASVDFDVFAIPQHRIQYFKYHDVIVWDKTKRLDNIFGSTGSGIKIHDVVSHCDAVCNREQESKKLHERDTSGTAEDLNTGDNSCDSSSNMNEPSAVLEPSEVKMSTEQHCMKDRDDVWGGNAVVLNTSDHCCDSSKNVNELSTVLKPSEIKDCTEQDWVEDKDDVWGVRQQPTHFLCIRITDAKIRNEVARFQHAIVNEKSPCDSCLVPLEVLHVTLCTLRMPNPEGIANICHILRSLKSKLSVPVDCPVNALIEGVDSFSDRVIYVKVHPNEYLTDVINQIRILFQDNAQEANANFDLTLHLTIIKLSRPASREMKQSVFGKEDCELFQSTHFGLQQVDALHLCEIGNHRRQDGFYMTQMSVPFIKAE